MSLAIRFTQQIPIAFVFAAGIAALAAGASLWQMPAISIKLWFSVCFLAAGPYLRYIYSRFEELQSIARQIPARPMRRTERFKLRRDFIDRLEDLVFGSEEVCVFNLSNPADNDRYVRRFVRRLRRYLKTPNIRLARYRRISSVSSRRGALWTLRALGKFRGVGKLEHLCVHRVRHVPCHLSFVLIKRPEGYYVFFFNMLKGAGDRMDVVMIHDDMIGDLMEREFDRLWRSIEQRQAPILKDGEIDTAEVEKLAGEFGCLDSPEYRRLTRNGWWYF